MGTAFAIGNPFGLDQSLISGPSTLRRAEASSSGRIALVQLQSIFALRESARGRITARGIYARRFATKP
jgi:hypothetical protein